MDATFSTHRKFGRMFVNILSIFVILAMAFPVTGSAFAQDEPPPPTPFIWADPICECLNGWDWGIGDSITIQVFDRENNQFDLQNPTQVYAADSGVFFELWAEGIDLQPGYRITMSNGLITKELIVSKLTVKEMNPVANTISGVRDPDLALFVHVEGQEALSYDFDGDRWVATFESLDGFGEAYQPDEDGDKTGMGWDGIPTFMRYDIYAFYVLSGNTQRVTTLDGTGEYNPSWSPNGKKIAHDVVYWDGSHGIYITDVKTGVSTALVGAEDGGNDAVWSPNGKWIAFDRHWVGDSNLYIVPATGGTRTLVKGNAISAGWAPNGKRLVFQDLDGSIHTIPIMGGKGIETTVAPNGANPVWSPDGTWIAYDYNGDIWKVRVNIHGVPLGEPIQVTSSPFTDGGPTWSADSQTIVFHSGMTGDYDLWSVPAEGGDPTWLNGAPEFGEYDPAYARDSSNIAYPSPSTEGQAARHWGAAFSYDVGTWADGEHSYYLEDTYAVPQLGGEITPVVSFTVSDEAQLYDGSVLLRGLALRARMGDECPAIDPPEINPAQNTRFHYGWVTDTPMTYADAVAHFNSMTVKAFWDDGMSADLIRHEIFSWSSVDWAQYICSATVP